MSGGPLTSTRIVLLLLICMMSMGRVHAQQKAATDPKQADQKEEKASGPQSIFQKIVSFFHTETDTPEAAAVAHPYTSDAAKDNPFLNNNPHIFQYIYYEDSTLKSEKQWTYASDVKKHDHKLKQHIDTKGEQVHHGFEVLGFHPYWMGEAYHDYQYDLLSSVAYCGYEVDPATGGYKGLHNWKSTALADSVYRHGRKLFLTVYNMGALNNAKLLVNPDAQQLLIDSVSLLVFERKAQGICLDFEDIPKFYSAHFTDLVIRMSKAIHKIDTGMKVYVTIPAVNVDDVYDVREMNDYVDQFILLAYGYYGQTNKIAGPNAPLQSKKTWSMYNVDNSVKYYNEVLGIKRRKLLLGVAYYGNFYETKDLGVPSEVLFYNYSKPYSYIRDLVEKKGEESLLDEESSSEYLSMPEEDGTAVQVWYDGPQSMELKYKYALEKGLGGIAIWGLGYDNGYPEMWQLLADNFTESHVESVRSGMTHDANGDWVFTLPPQPQDNELDQIESSLEDVIGDNGIKSVLLVLLLVLACFFLIGFVLSFVNERMSQLFKDRVTIIYFVVHIIVLMSVLMFELFYDVEANWIMFIYGVILSSLFMSLLYLVTKKSKEQP